MTDFLLFLCIVIAWAVAMTGAANLDRIKAFTLRVRLPRLTSTRFAPPPVLEQHPNPQRAWQEGDILIVAGQVCRVTATRDSDGHQQVVAEPVLLAPSSTSIH